MSLFEIAFLAVVALMVFGPKKIFELAPQVAKTMAKVRQTSNELKSQLFTE